MYVSLSRDPIEILRLAALSTYAFELQMFAAEDEGRTEEATEYKKKKAREEGNVPKSQELTAIVVFLLCFWTLSLVARQTYQGLKDIMTFYITNLLNIDIRGNNLTHLMGQMIWMTARVMLPVMGVGVVAAFLINVAQTGFMFTPKKIAINFEKWLSGIGKNFARMFWSSETMFNLFKSILKIAGVFAIAFIMVSNRIVQILTMPRLSGEQGLIIIAQLIFQFVSISGVMLLVFAIGDYAFQRWQYTQSLKMTRQEVKQEMKEMEGDPEIKAKIREMERRLLSRKMIQEVPRADVVITNPTHFAVAIKYDPNYMAAPVVVAKGQDAFAQRIKEVAKEHNVYVIENKPLARELYKKVEVGQEIPADLFLAVAKVLSLVYKMRSSISAA